MIAQKIKAEPGFFITVKSVRKAFEAMSNELGLPRDLETGTKLVRRSMATHARKPLYLGEEHWSQGRIVLGHDKHAVSDVYALPDPANLGRALQATESIINEIEGLCPGAFTGNTPDLQLLSGGAN